MSEEEKEAGVPDTREVKKTVEIKEKTIETKPKRSLSDMELVLVVLLALVIGAIIAFFIKRFLDDRHSPTGPEVPYEPYPRYMPFIPPPPIRPKSRKRRKAGGDIDPLMIARTPPELRRHNIYLDDMGEAVLSAPTVYEVWQIQRDESGEIVDAIKMREDEN